MSSDAGWTHEGSNGSMPMRPAAMAARMSRSDRTTTTQYGRSLRELNGGPCPRRERQHRASQLGPGADEDVGTREALTRIAPRDLDGAHARGARHLDVRRR